MNHLGIANDFHGHEPHRRGRVVLADLAVVTLDRSENQVLNRTDVLQCGRDLGGTRQVESNAVGATADLPGGALGAGSVATDDEDFVPVVGKTTSQLFTQAVGAADDDDTTVVVHHGVSRPSRDLR